MGTRAKGCIRWMAAGAMLLPGVLAVAQQGGQAASAGNSRAAVAQPARRAPVRVPVGPSRPVHTGRSGFRANAQDATTGVGVPRPTWELPRTVTPQWEIPNYNPVQPNQVLGNPIDRSNGLVTGGFVGYGAFPNYSFIEPSPSDVQATEGGAGPQGEDPGPAGYPPDGPQGSPDARQGPGYGQRPGYGQGPGYAAGENLREAPGQPRYERPYGGRGSTPRRAPYQPETRATAEAPRSAAQTSDGLEHPAITLIFRDGRPQQQIRSYVLTGTTLLVIENGHQSRIPLADLDLPATEKRNRDSGADFSVPGGSQ